MNEKKWINFSLFWIILELERLLIDTLRTTHLLEVDLDIITIVCLQQYFMDLLLINIH